MRYLYFLLTIFLFSACNNDPKETSQIQLKSVRDFSDGSFSTDEIDFITKYFKQELIDVLEEDGAEVSMDSTSVRVSSEGESGYVPAFDFPRTFNTSLAGDLDGDGTSEIIFTAEVTGGGTAYWDQLYCLKVFPNDGFLLFEMDVPCPCRGNYECRDPSLEVIDAKGDILTIRSSCFLDSDANCCPSLIKKFKYRFLNTSLLFVN
jgi:hypothetical protein